MLVALDTNVLLYAHQEVRPHDSEALKALKLESRRLLSKQGLDFLVPAPALGEWLSDYEDGPRTQVWNALQDWSWVGVYDAHVALIVGGLWRQRKVRMNHKERSWSCVKVDLEIIACAIRWGASGMCSNDQGLLQDWGRWAPEGSLGGPPSVFLERV